MADQHTPNPSTGIPATVDGVDTSDVAAAHVTVADLFATVINPVTAGCVDALYAEHAAAMADVSAVELLDADPAQLVRLALVALQDAAGALQALVATDPRHASARQSLADALTAETARTLYVLDRAHVDGR